MQLGDLLEQARGLVVDNEGAFTTITSIYAQARQMEKLINDRLKEANRPAQDSINANKDIAQSFLTPIRGIVRSMQQSNEPMEGAARGEKQAEAAQIQQAAAVFDAPVPYIAPVDKTLKGKGATSITKKRMRFELLELEKVPLRYLQLNERAVEYDIKLGVGSIYPTEDLGRDILRIAGEVIDAEGRICTTQRKSTTNTNFNTKLTQRKPMNKSFLPQDYVPPSAEGRDYPKLQDGENKIRILSQPIIGWVRLGNNKPMRFPFDEKPPHSVDPLKPIKHFWAFVVWNYTLEAIQILEIAQATVRSALEILCRDEDWGEPYFYDIKILKSGQGKDTVYTVNPMPKETGGSILVKPIKPSHASWIIYLRAKIPGTT